MDPQPEMRRELEGAGFVLVGGCSLTADGIREVSRAARPYGKHAAEFARRAVEPGQVFAAPDGTAFVQLAWLWDCRCAVFTSVRGDGRILQTMTDWEAAPRWPTGLARHYDRTTDVHREQLVLATDLDAQVVPDGVLAAWGVHRDRLSTLPAPPPHTSLGDFVRIHAAESRARSSWTSRVRVVSWILAFAFVLVPFEVVTLALGPQPWWTDLGMLAGAGLLFLTAYLPIWLRLRLWRRLRPRFRAPVPGVGVTA